MVEINFIRRFIKLLNQNLGPVYTMPFSIENGTKSFLNWHQMKTILKMAQFENGMKCFSINIGKWNDFITN